MTSLINSKVGRDGTWRSYLITSPTPTPPHPKPSPSSNNDSTLSPPAFRHPSILSHLLITPFLLIILLHLILPISLSSSASHPSSAQVVISLIILLIYLRYRNPPFYSLFSLFASPLPLSSLSPSLSPPPPIFPPSPFRLFTFQVVILPSVLSPWSSSPSSSPSSSLSSSSSASPTSPLPYLSPAPPYLPSPYPHPPLPHSFHPTESLCTWKLATSWYHMWLRSDLRHLAFTLYIVLFFPLSVLLSF